VPDLILPVLNEAEALPWVLGRVPPGYRPLVVDNGSTDGSRTVAAASGATVVDEPRRGFGAACWAGLVAAVDDVVCFMDADGSLDPADLPAVAGPVLRDEADLVLGARQADRGAWPMHARLANRALAFQIRRRAGLRLRDLGPMRAARRSDLLALGIVDRRFGWPLEMVLRAARGGWRILEVPVAYRSRAGGRSKVTGSLAGTIRATADMARVLRSQPSSWTAPGAVAAPGTGPETQREQPDGAAQEQ
jgi:glycosyltransferase involved in cell wall biosynthesis